MRLLVTWSRLGPYHHARLRGLQSVAGEGVEVIGLAVASRDQYAWRAGEPCTTVRIETLFPGQDYASIGGRRIARACWRQLDALRPGAVAVNGWSMPEALAAMAWCRWRRVPCIVMSETLAGARSGPGQWLREGFKRWLLRGCAAALVGGQAHRDYVATLGMPAERVLLGYDAVDNEYFQAGAETARRDAAATRARLGLPDRYFFACSRFLPRKNIDGLLRAYARYRERCVGRPWSLVISGSGDEEAGLRRLARDLDVDGVYWPGFVQYADLPACYGLASAFVHPARAEAWGLVVNEAAACGLPLLVGDAVGARATLVHDGVNGFGFDADSDDALLEVLLDLHGRTPEERRDMGEASRRIVSDWSPRRFGEGMLAAVRLAGGGGQAAGRAVPSSR